MNSIESEAFPDLERPTKFRRELQRNDVVYLVATRPWTKEERDAARRGERSNNRQPATADLVGRAQHSLEGLMFQALGLIGKNLPAEHVGGFQGIWFALDTAHLTVIASRPDERRKGIGELLLMAAVELAMHRTSRTVTLEVRASNEAARALYRKYAFQDVGVRKRYYSGGEDAIIMTTPPIWSKDYIAHFSLLTRKFEARWGESHRVLI